MLRDKEWLEQKYLVEGLNQQRIAFLLGCAPPKVAYWLKKHGIERRMRIGLWSEEENSLLTERWAAGDRVVDIASALGRTVDSVRQHVGVLNLPPRPYGRQNKLVDRGPNGGRMKSVPSIAVLNPRAGRFDSRAAIERLLEFGRRTA